MRTAKKTYTILTVVILTVIAVQYGCNKTNNLNDNPNQIEQIPELTTLPANNITKTTAISGGNITNNGGKPITSRGICWNIFQNPTIYDNITIDGSGTGVFSSNLTNLVPNTTYYIRAYAINKIGVAYGNEENFTTSYSLVTGQHYGGGIIIHLEENGKHGLIAADYDQSANAEWGCPGIIIPNMPDNNTDVGTGQANTIAIVNACTTPGIAARICNDLTLNGYSDWFLPSVDEMMCMRHTNGLNLSKEGYYWSSTNLPEEYYGAWQQSFSYANDFSGYINSRNTENKVRAIRKF